MPRPTKIIIDLKAMRKNLEIARGSANAKVIAVVKANAYGHGLDRVLPVVEQADALALLEIDRAIELRQAGFVKPIILLEGFFDPNEISIFSRKNLTAVIHHKDQVDMLVSANLEKPIGIFLKMNSGMNRLGFSIEDFDKMYQTLLISKNVNSIVAMTHFADADGEKGIEWQLKRFKAAKTAALRNVETSMGNSATILKYPEAVGDWSRPGIMLYGAAPFPAAGQSLFPVMSLISEIISTQIVDKGQTIGYGCDYICEKKMLVGIVACGYGDGYPRNVISGTPVMIGKFKAPIVGRISMDLLAVDLSNLPRLDQKTVVTMWGNGLPVESIAKAAKTISYDLLCRVSNRVPARVLSL